jgi:hypothetical protein
VRRYDHLEIEAALRALDAVCTESHRLVVIGGAAVALHTRIPSGTQDIDHLLPDIEVLLARCKATHLELPPFSASTVAEYPWDAEDRLQRVLPELARLEVWLLEPHDLVLSKVIRWHDGDEEDARELHRASPLSQPILLERYLHEMDHVMGDPLRRGLNFVECIDRLFGEITADEARDAIERDRAAPATTRTGARASGRARTAGTGGGRRRGR